ncbi:MAG: tetratricopeptide repeat protein [Deltaproteobacteria bacterium]|nr:tetratricopeptide repeat protein [Candidatus Zymogenaceae bacterium]
MIETRKTAHAALHTHGGNRLGALCGAIVALIAVLLILPAVFSADTYALKDLLGDAELDPAYAADRYKTRIDMLSGVVGAETWVEHYIDDAGKIELLIYNNLIYGVIIRPTSGSVKYYTLNDDRRTYSAAASGSPQGWLIDEMPTEEDFLERAAELLDSGRYIDVIEVLDEAIEDYGYKSAESYFLMAYAYDQMDEIEYAKDYYTLALRLDGTIADALYNLGMIYRNEGNHTEAAKYLERYIKLNPSHPDIESIRAYVESNR